MVKILAALSILNSSGAIKKVAALVERAGCSGASHSSVPMFLYLISILSFQCASVRVNTRAWFHIFYSCTESNLLFPNKP